TAGATYTFSYDAANDALTLTRDTDNVAQTVTLVANSQTLNFDALGISVTLAGTDSADNIGNALDGDAIVMSSATGSATFQIGADTGQTITAAFNAMNAASLGVGSGTDINAAVNAYAALGTSGTDAQFKAA